MIKVFGVLALAGAAALALCGCNRNKGQIMDGPGMVYNPIENYVNYTTAKEGDLLFDYFHRQAEGLNGGGSTPAHVELTISKHDLNSVTISVYTKEAGSTEEKCESFQRDIYAIEEAYRIVDQKKLDTWNSMSNASAMTGDLYVCKFMKGGEMVRVSSERMPKNGMDVFRDIEELFAEYIDELPDLAALGGAPQAEGEGAEAEETGEASAETAK